MLTKENYQQWVNHPQTKEFHQYLKDYRKTLMERWAQGKLSEVDNLMAIARAQMADDILTLDDDSISQFYESFKEEETND